MSVKKFYVTGGSIIPQPDWNQTDTTQADFIKNKPDDLATETYVTEAIQDCQTKEAMVGQFTSDTVSNEQYPTTAATASFVYSNTPIHYPTQIEIAPTEWVDNSVVKTEIMGVTDTNLIQVTPAPESIMDWGNSGIYCSAQSAASLTFICTEVPTNTIVVNIVICDTFAYGDEVEY